MSEAHKASSMCDQGCVLDGWYGLNISWYGPTCIMMWHFWTNRFRRCFLTGLILSTSEYGLVAQFFLLRESSNLWSMVEHHNISKISVLRRDVSTSGMHFISPLWLYVSPSKHTCLLLYVVTMWILIAFYKSNYLNTSFSLFLTF